MNQLTRNALATVPLSEETVLSFYDGSRSGAAEQCLKALCVSHERLRAEVQGCEALLAEDPGKSALRSLLTAAKEAAATLRATNGHERRLYLDDAAEAVEQSLSPRQAASDFTTWLE